MQRIEGGFEIVRSVTTPSTDEGDGIQRAQGGFSVNEKADSNGQAQKPNSADGVNIPPDFFRSITGDVVNRGAPREPFRPDRNDRKSPW